MWKCREIFPEDFFAFPFPFPNFLGFFFGNLCILMNFNEILKSALILFKLHLHVFLSLCSRFPHASSVLTVIEESDPEIPVETDSDTDMSVSHVGVLSTTLTLRPKVSREGREDGKKVHKVSLVSNSSSTNSSMPHGRVVEKIENGVKNNGADGESRFKGLDEWKPSLSEPRVFEEESRSFSADSVESEVSDNTNLYSSHFRSSEYEPTARSSQSFSEREWETLPSPVSVNTAGNHGNTTWWNVRSEVQESGERQTGGRSWAGLAEPAEKSELKREGGITNTDSHYSAEETEGFLSGVFKATRVDLSPTEPDPETITSPHDMDTLVDTLKSMAPVRHRPLRSAPSLPFLSLPPIVEDTPGASAHGFGFSGVSGLTSPTSPQPQNSLPPDLGLNWASKDMRSPLAMMSMLKEQQSQDLQGRSPTLAPRASALNAFYMRKNSLPNLSLEEGTQVNGILGPSRLDHSLLFSSYRSEQKEENGKPVGQRTLFRAASLPEVNSGNDYLSRISKAPDSLGSAGSKYELSFLMSPPSSLPGLIEPSRISRSPLIISSPTAESPTSIITSPVLHGLSPESSVKLQNLQLNLGMGAAPLGSPVHNGVGNVEATQKPGPDRNLLTKYKAFPDAYVSSVGWVMGSGLWMLFGCLM